MRAIDPVPGFCITSFDLVPSHNKLLRRPANYEFTPMTINLFRLAASCRSDALQVSMQWPGRPGRGLFDINLPLVVQAGWKVDHDSRQLCMFVFRESQT
jgi:hypothetical protein